MSSRILNTYIEGVLSDYSP